jgi:hypothetical protein
MLRKTNANPPVGLSPAIIVMVLACAAVAIAQTDPNPPTLPTIGSTVYNVTLSNSLIDGGAVAVANGTSTNNTTVINDFISYAASHGGGTVEIPSATKAYGADELLMGNNVNLQVDTGATLQNLAPDNTFISTAGGTSGNVEISGGGIINDAATNTSSNNMVTLDGLTNLEVTNVTIENASHEHLVPENDTNVTINNVTIQDSKIQANTDGIDFSGTNFLIENCHIADGDDDIVAKPESVHCGNIFIVGDTITAGHGISIGGQTNAGLNGMYVTNCTITGTVAAPVENGIRLKAGDGTAAAGTANGGLVQNVTFNNITMTNVNAALIVDSFYNNGSSNYPSKPSASAPFPVAPTDSTEPLWQNITFENITAAGVTSNAADIYGLNSSPANMDGLNFENITIASGNPWNMYYSDDIYMSGVAVNGATIPDSLSGGQAQEFADTFDGTANTSYNPLPEPGALSLIGLIGMSLLRRRRAGR